MRIVTALLVVLGSSLSSASSRAADASTETRLRDALRTTASQLRALEEEQARWKEKEGQYKAELESLREQLAAARKDGAKQGGKREADRLAQSLAEQSEARAKLTESLAQCQKAVRETSEAARAGEEERARQAGRLDGLTARAAACEGRNARMFKAGKDLLDWLSEIGIGESLWAREPILGLRRVEMENAIQDYEDKLLEARIQAQRPDQERTP